MKFLPLILSLLLTATLSAQSTDSLGIENTIRLNPQEIQFLNSSLEKSRGSFDFENKKVAFVTGSAGTKLISKQDFFLNNVNPWLNNGTKPKLFAIQLTNEEKLKSNGYDAVVMSWVKIFSDKQRRKIIEQLNRDN